MEENNSLGAQQGRTGRAMSWQSQDYTINVRRMASMAHYIAQAVQTYRQGMPL